MPVRRREAEPDVGAGGGVEGPVSRRRKKSSFGGDVLKLVFGTTFVQVLGVLTAPILTRIYAAEAFGLAAILGSISGIIGVIACLRYEAAILLPESDEEATNLFAVSVAVSLVIGALTVPLIWLGDDAIVGFLKAPRLKPWLWMVPLTILGQGLFLALNYWNSRTGQFGRLARNRLWSATATNVVQFGGGLAGHATGGTLFAANLIGSGFSNGLLGTQILREDGRLFRRSIRWSRMWEGMRRHSKFPRYGVVSSLLNTASWQLPTLVLQFFFSSTVVGFYALGNRLLRVPMNLIGGAISQVFFQRAAEAYRAGELAPIVEATFRRLVAFSMFPMVILSVVGEEVFSVFLGANWAEAGIYTQILSLWTLFWFISSPMSTLNGVLEKQEFGLKMNVVIFATRLASLALGAWLGGPRTAMALFAVSGVAVYGYMSFALMGFAGVPRRSMARIFAQNALLVLPAAGILLVLKLSGASPLVIVAAACLFGVGYAVYLAKTDPQIFDRLKSTSLATATTIRGLTRVAAGCRGARRGPARSSLANSMFRKGREGILDRRIRSDGAGRSPATERQARELPDAAALRARSRISVVRRWRDAALGGSPVRMARSRPAPGRRRSRPRYRGERRLLFPPSGLRPSGTSRAYEPYAAHARAIELLRGFCGLAPHRLVVEPRGVALKDVSALPESRLVLLLNVLQHAGQDFDADLVRSPEDWRGYAIEYLQRLGRRTEYLFFQLGYTWLGSRQKLCEDDDILDFTLDLVTSAGWNVVRCGLIRRARDPSPVYEDPVSHWIGAIR